MEHKRSQKHWNNLQLNVHQPLFPLIFVSWIFVVRIINHQVTKLEVSQSFYTGADQKVV